jgi:hypothetical protein
MSVPASARELRLRLTRDELEFLKHHLRVPGPGGGPPGAALATAEESLQGRRLAARSADGALQLDHTVVALVGSWLRPVAGVRAAVAEAGAVREWDFHHLAAMTVEHYLEDGAHVFLAHASLAALAGRLGALAGMAGQPRPPGGRLWLPRATAEAIWAAAGAAGVGGVRRVLARWGGGRAGGAAGTETTARSLGRALERARRLVRLEVFAGPSPLGGLRLVEGDGGYWAFTTGPGEDGKDGEDGGEDDGVDVRPVSGDEVGGLLTVMAGAVVRPRRAAG